MYDKKILAKGTAASFGVVMLVAMLIASSGMAFAAPIAGIGGFTINADELRGNDLYLYPGASDTSERSAVPVATAEFSSVEIDGLELIKEIEDVPAPVGGNMRIVITATDTVEADSLLVKQTKLSASQSTFNGLLIDEENSDDVTEQFKQVAPSTSEQRTEGVDGNGAFGGGEAKTISLSDASNPGIVLQNASIQAHYQAVNEISIPGLTLTAEHDANGDGDYTDDGDITLGS